jgi:hypothetical protein
MLRRGSAMTTLLQKAIDAITKLPAEEQDILAARLLAELGEEDQFDRVIADSSGRLSDLAREALDEHHSRLTEELDPERL